MRNTIVTLLAVTLFQPSDSAWGAQACVQQICAVPYGGGIDTRLTWSMKGPGAFTMFENCILYVAPAPGSFSDSQLVEIQVCSLPFPDQCATRYLTVDPPGAIRSSGQTHAAFKPFDDFMRQYSNAASAAPSSA